MGNLAGFGPDQVRLAIRQLITARPFKPIFVKPLAQDFLIVQHPENLGCSTSGTLIVVFDAQGIHTFETRHIEWIADNVMG